MTDTWNDLAADWDDNPSVLRFADNAYRSLREAVDLRGRRILDFGCGTGLLSARMAPDAAQIVALDPSAAMASKVRVKQLPKVQVCESVLDPQAPMLAEPFDLVVASSALGFVEDVSATLNTIRQLLRPGGTLVHWDWCQIDGAAGPGFSLAQAQHQLQAAGFGHCAVRVAFSMVVNDRAADVLMAIAKTPA